MAERSGGLPATLADAPNRTSLTSDAGRMSIFGMVVLAVVRRKE